MLPALGALSSVLDGLLSPTSSKSTSSQPTANNPFDLAGNAASSGSSTAASCTGGCSQISPATMSALLAAQDQSTAASVAPTSRADALKDLFSQLDANGDGKVSKAEFESALGAGGTNLAQADDVFNKLDANGDGSVSLDELTSALKGAGGKGHHHHHHHVAGSDGSGAAGDSSATERIEYRSAAASVERRIQYAGYQQRRHDHHVGDLCRWLEGDVDIGAGNEFVVQRDFIL